MCSSNDDSAMPSQAGACNGHGQRSAERAGCGRNGRHHQAAGHVPEVHSLREALQPSAVVRQVPASHELDFPEVPFPSERVLHAAGAERIRALVLRHHARLRTSEIGKLFPRDQAEFAALAEKAATFAIEACGGPSSYSDARGHTCMRTRHLPFTIDERARAVWLSALWQAFDDVGFPHEVREEYWAWVEAMSIRMINRRRTRAQPARHAYADMLGMGALALPLTDGHG
jgi:hemoglobin